MDATNGDHPTDPVDPDPSTTRRATHSITLKDVAKLAQVSAQTVSRSIRIPEHVSGKTLARVREAISATGYVPNLAASSLASNRSRTVAAIIPTIAVSIFADLLHGLESVLTPRGIQLFVGSSGYDLDHEEELIRSFMGRRPEAFVIIGTEHSLGTMSLLANGRIPVVEAWGSTGTPIDSLVGFSSGAAIESLVEHLASKGYSKLTFSGMVQRGNSRAVERREGFVNAVTKQFPGEPVRIVESSSPNFNSMQEGVVLLDAALSRYPETDALMFASDAFAAGALLECNRRSIQVPRDLAITGFGDYEISQHLIPTITTVALPNVDMGTRAGRLILARIDDPEIGPEIVDLGFSLCVREST